MLHTRGLTTLLLCSNPTPLCVGLVDCLVWLFHFAYSLPSQMSGGETEVSPATLPPSPSDLLELLATPERRPAMSVPDAMVPAVPSTVSPSLKAVLDRNGVEPEVVAFLAASGCREIAAFANWVDERAELKAAVLDKTAKKDNHSQLAALKQAWREADALNSRSLKRSAEGLSAEELDGPLDPELQKQVEAAFRTTYSWPGLPSKCVGCDSLLGRCKREFERRTPSMLAVTRVRTLAQSQRGQPVKVQRLSADVSLQLGEGEDEANEATSSLYAWLLLLRVLCTTWAVAGCFDVDVNGQRTKFVHWSQSTEYWEELSARAHEALSQYAEASVVAWVSSLEEEFRSRAIELTRGVRQEPWGKALLEALRELSHRFAETRDRMTPRRRATDQVINPKAKPQIPPPPPGAPPISKATPPPPPGGAAVSRKRWKTASQLPNGSRLCKRFNDPRGCQKVCPQGCAHACDILLLSSNAACGRKDHNRGSHDPARHGNPAVQ